MLVYGDHAEEVAPAAALRQLNQDSGRFLDHDRLRRRFIALAGLTQGVADSDFDAFGCDRARADEAALLALLLELGAVLMRSWDTGCAGGVAPSIEVPPVLPGRATVKRAEGYAFYALFPEAFGLAARQLRLQARPRVIGLRSIGAGLAAIAAAALGSQPPITLRPSGDPFARSLKLDPKLDDALLDGDVHYVIVDEGPGLSGSSFGCVADWLEDQGVARARIAFLPGHDGDLGPEASPRHRTRWSEAQRPVATVDRLRSWVETMVGPIERWDDVSAGAWRSFWSAAEADWPAVTPGWERSKFLVRARETSWLVRFAGLGREGQEKLALARHLQGSGFGPEVAGLTHGWLIQRWHEDARPTRPSLEELAAYLRLRAFLPAEQGAGLSDLVTMVRRNAPQLGRWNPAVEVLEQKVRPVRIDGKLQPHEWLRLPSGRLLKADALDHHQAHDLIGCQDLAWDVAGAVIELDLAPGDVDQLEQALGVDPALTGFYRVAYAGFRLGAHRVSEAMVGPEEAARHRAAAERHELALVDAVEHSGDIDKPVGLGVEAVA